MLVKLILLAVLTELPFSWCHFSIINEDFAKKSVILPKINSQIQDFCASNTRFSLEPL